jgi:predicted lipoprotein with Yx(FWY)xxD motif
MKSFLKCASAMAAIVLLTGMASAADAISAGKVKAVHSEKKEFVLTDAGGKDRTIKLGDNVVINHGGKESKSDLNVGDMVAVCHDNGTLSWTAHYILVKKDASKNWKLVQGTFKGYDTDQKRLAFTDHAGKDLAFAWGDGKVRLNRKYTSVDHIKIGDKGLFILDKSGDATTLKAVILKRK